MPPHFHIFRTAHGHAAIGWNDGKIVSFRLPATTEAEAERTLLRRLPDAIPAEPPAEIRTVIDGAIRYFAGEWVDFRHAPIDLGPQEPFFATVYAYVRTFGWGETTTYGEIAKALEHGPEAARVVGQAMARNPIPLIIPCHRVLAAGGKVGGFSAPGGAYSKARMLEIEGVTVPPPPPVQVAFNF